MGRIAEPGHDTGMKAALYQVLLVAFLLIALSVVLAIPTYFETTTLWYKTGIDRIMLKGAQYLGLVALVLIYLQVFLSLRGDILRSVFGAASLIRYHRVNGLLVLFMATAHVLLVLMPEGLGNLPIGKKFWPEMVGAGLFVIITALVLSSSFRQRLRLPFTVWSVIHKPAGYAALLLVTIHVLFVSESFEQPVPRISLIILFTLTVIGTAVVKLRAWRRARPQPPRRHP